MRKIAIILMLSIFSFSLNAQNSSEQQVRRAISPDAQTQPIPAERLAAKGKVFTVNKSGDKAMVDITISATCDFFPAECSYNIWDFTNSVYLWASDQTFSGINETIVTNIAVPEGDYSIDCFDTFGDGGIEGTVTDDATSSVLVQWFNNSYAFFGEFTFTAVAPPTVPLSNWAFALIGVLALTFVFIKFRK